MKSVTLLPSVHPTQEGVFEERLDSIGKTCRKLHLDIADGNYVPHMTSKLKNLKEKGADYLFEIHLMVSQPELEVENWNLPNIETIYFHSDCESSAATVIDSIRLIGKKVGIVFSPEANFNHWVDSLYKFDAVSLMGKKPGNHRGVLSKLDPNVYKRITVARSETPPSTSIEVDGGVSLKNAGDLLKSGADTLVSGRSFLFSEASTFGLQYQKFSSRLKELGFSI